MIMALTVPNTIAAACIIGVAIKPLDTVTVHVETSFLAIFEATSPISAACTILGSDRARVAAPLLGTGLLFVDLRPPGPCSRAEG